ncbi:hypothetical protein vseg_016911 [Gypsophila vaccaria]
MERGCESLISNIRHLKLEIEEGRRMEVKDKLKQNGKKLLSHTRDLWSGASMIISSVDNNSIDVPRLEVGSALCVLDGFLPGTEDKDHGNLLEAISSKSTMLPKVQSIPPYTTWIFLDRNQRMAEDQSVVGRRRIYYDQSGNEALICSDSEDDPADIGEEKREFSDGEDRILWMAFQKHGINEDVADVVRQFIGGTSSEILERYNELKLKLEASHAQGSTKRDLPLEKSLSGALDSFDNLFCRRCLVFDCRLHGCSQTLVYPSEKPLGGPESEDRKPCSDQCYLVAGQTADNPVEISNVDSLHQMEGDIEGEENKSPRVVSSENSLGNETDDKVSSIKPEAEEGPKIRLLSGTTDLTIDCQTVVGKRKTFDDSGEKLQRSDSSKYADDKKQKKTQLAEATSFFGGIVSEKTISFADARISSVTSADKDTSQLPNRHYMQGHATSTSQKIDDELCIISTRTALEQSTTFDAKRKGVSRSSEWNPLEIDLYIKGLEIFGRNSCLIARNLLSDLKTCTEVYNYMRTNGAGMTQNKDIVHCLEDGARANVDHAEQNILLRPRSRIFRKRGKTRRLKYSSKSTGHPSSWKRIGDESQSCKQYSPCTCELMCGKDCSCLKIGNCCEKYCGCSKSCKNRFRGCHCAKSQCRSRQCPCFAANRECDPDVCRNCWVSCGGGSLGEPPKKGDGQCGNMKLLLRQQKRVLLGRSDVAGWGAFIKNTVNKNEYLGEYTGELISHREADKRGKIYDRANSSFLFDLNDQFVLDACRKGDKLKFANHSANPNCYCKVMLVAGDHRVGIFAKERIEALEELFYDYRYGPEQAPEWARRPETSKKDESLSSQTRARKHQSR